MTRFEWRVADNGYRWTADDLLFAPEGSSFEKKIKPLEEEKYSGLFRTFAKTPTTKEGVLDFANKYGHLGTGAGGVGGDIDFEWEYWDDEKWEEWERNVRCEETNPPDMEPFEFWSYHITRMRQCVKTWDKVQSGEAVEKEMQRLQVTVSNNLRGRVRVAFSRDPERIGGFLLQIKPNTLLGALWLQLAETISGCRKHRACAACRNWFEVSPEMFRKNRVYCSEECRSRAYRKRKEKARQLAKEGKTVKEIAAQLGSNAEAVRGWLKQKRSGDG